MSIRCYFLINYTIIAIMQTVFLHFAMFYEFIISLGKVKGHLHRQRQKASVQRLKQQYI